MAYIYIVENMIILPSRSAESTSFYQKRCKAHIKSRNEILTCIVSFIMQI